MYRHVVLLSVDGLRSDVMVLYGERLPHLRRLLGGAATLDARTDPDFTTTLPNHTGMATGLSVQAAPPAEGHAWRGNTTPVADKKIHDHAGQPFPSVFDGASAAGVHTAMIAAKEKFILFPRTWNGKLKLGEERAVPLFVLTPDAADGVASAIDFLRGHAEEASFLFLHLREPDTAGHDAGWDVAADSTYLQAIATVDAALGELFAYWDANPELRARTAVVVTSDHGGGVPWKNHHAYGRSWVNVTVPLGVWTGDGHADGDLYALNPDRRAPGLRDPRHDDPGPAPWRNLDAGPLALQLLGLADDAVARLREAEEQAVGR